MGTKVGKKDPTDLLPKVTPEKTQKNHGHPSSIKIVACQLGNPIRASFVRVPSMALYFFSISTILGGPGGPFAISGTEGFSKRFSHSDIESPPLDLTSDFYKL